MYQNKRNGEVAKLVQMDDKFKTVLLEKEDGKTVNVTFSTFKRWWKRLDTVEAVEPEKTPEQDQEDITEVMEQEVTEQPVKQDKPAKVKKARTPKKVDPDVTDVKNFIQDEVVDNMGCELFKTPKAPNVVVFKVDGHMFGRINCSCKQVTLCLRSAAFTDVQQPDKQLNHIFDAGYIFTTLGEDGEIEDLICKLLQAAMNHQVAKKAQVKNKKSKKTEKEEV